MPRRLLTTALLLTATLGACASPAPPTQPELTARPAGFATAAEGWRALDEAERARDLLRAQQIMAALRRDWRRSMTLAQRLRLENLDGDLARTAGRPDEARKHYQRVARATAKLDLSADRASHTQGARALVGQMILLNEEVTRTSISGDPQQLKEELQAAIGLSRRIHDLGVKAREHRDAYWAQASVVEHARSMDILADLILNIPAPQSIQDNPDAEQVYRKALLDKTNALREQATRIYKRALEITHDQPDSPWAAHARGRVANSNP